MKTTSAGLENSGTSIKTGNTFLALCLLDITNSTREVGLVYFINTVGFILFTILGGYLGDRISKRTILCYSDLGRGIFVLAMIAAIAVKSMALIYCLHFFCRCLARSIVR